MPIEIPKFVEEFVDLKLHTTFRMGGKARYFAVVNSVDQLPQLFVFAGQAGLPVTVLGEGSNIIVSAQNIFEAVVMKIEIPGFTVLEESEEAVKLRVGAGENWDSVVRRAVEQGWSGIEAMSFIPGTAGATPIQNVGAYGSEIADVLESVEVYDLQTEQTKDMTKKDCQFSYRDSIFKHSAKGKYVITAITLSLSKQSATVPNYPGVQKYLDEHSIKEPTLPQIREAIIAIRQFKLPDPKDVASVGSFFKNPIVSAEQFEQLQGQYPKMIAFPLENGQYKIGAGWLLENLGLKGQQFGNLQFYPNNALVLTNVGGASFKELEDLVETIKARTWQAYEIKLEMEPIIV